MKYTPTQAGPQTITGVYSGDTAYSGSAGTFLLNAANQGDQAVGLALQSAGLKGYTSSGNYAVLYGKNLDVLQTSCLPGSVRAPV
jgi:hypothetical protein